LWARCGVCGDPVGHPCHLRGPLCPSEQEARRRSMSSPRLTRIRPSRLALYTALAVVLLMTLGPYIVMLLTSLMPRTQLASAGASLLPDHVTFASYNELVTGTDFLQYLWNSVFVALIAVPLTLVVSTGAA